MHERTGCCLLLATFACLAPTGCVGGNPMNDSPVRLWATGDGVRVNPQTGRYLEDRTDIHKDYPTGDYRKRSRGRSRVLSRLLRCIFKDTPGSRREPGPRISIPPRPESGTIGEHSATAPALEPTNRGSSVS